jgi:hypothetical protein
MGYRIVLGGGLSVQDLKMSFRKNGPLDANWLRISDPFSDLDFGNKTILVKSNELSGSVSRYGKEVLAIDHNLEDSIAVL